MTLPSRVAHLYRPALSLIAWTLVSAKAPTVPSAPTARQWVEVRNVDLHLNERITLRVRSVHGEIFRTTPDRPAALDDPKSFRIRVSAGTVALTGDDLSALMNTIILAYPGSPLTDVHIRFDAGQLIVKGTLHKSGTHPVELTGTVGVTQDQRIRLHVLRSHVVGVNGEQLLHIVGLHLDNVVDLTGARGATIKGDDIFLSPLPFLPPPAIDGALAAVRIEGDRLIEEFTTTADDSTFRHNVRADSSTLNYIYFRGGELRFGRLLMQDTDLRIHGGDAHTPLDLDLPHYTRQLVAGYSRTRADSGLSVYMPNSASLASAPR
jgi:hypothetical protein